MGFIQSYYGTIGNFELVVREGDGLRHYYRDNDSGFKWIKHVKFGNNVTGFPVLMQCRNSNFEVIVPEKDGLRHYYRDQAAGFKWIKNVKFGDNNISRIPCSLIQSNLGNYGNFHTVVGEGEELFVGNRLRHYWRDMDAPGFPWKKDEELFGENIISGAALIQSNLGEKGNFEVVVVEKGRLGHYSRNNDYPDQPWVKVHTFGESITSAPALIQTNFGQKGKLLVVVKEGRLFEEKGQLREYWLDTDTPGSTWIKGELFGEDVTGTPELIQSRPGTLGNKGNFELIVEEGGHWRHYHRDNDVSQRWYKDEKIG